MDEQQKDIYHEKAMELVLGGKSLFITGKAGTGKSYLIHNIVAKCKELGKNVVVAAPTGIAAMNAEGTTLHSLLKLPLLPYIPNVRIPRLYSLSDSERQVVKMIDIMIIDEISMVRCDMLDMIDDVLRHYRENKKPFGGIQMVLVGDLYQLMPVATEEDWEKLQKVYKIPYFFGSLVYQKVKYPLFELKTIHRQEDNNFRILLNNIREGHVTYYEVHKLQERYTEDPKITNDCDFLRLTTHNFLAKAYNWKRLEALPGELRTFTAIRIGFFPQEENPTDYNLKLKIGAKVMFVKNDNDYHQYVNGTLGTVLKLYPEVIVLTDNGKRITAKPVKWDLYKYTVNKLTQQLETNLLGSFIQLPLIHAWAVTIHKSQGLTFDKVVIDAGRAFTYGQVYVALSRCKTFHNLYLVSKITEKIIKTDPTVVQFMENTKTLHIKGEKKKEKKHTAREHLGLGASVDNTLWMVEDGLNFEQMLKQSGERPEILYSHLAKLIELGKIGIERFILKQTYKEISFAYDTLGDDATLKAIREACESKPKFGEINMVRASRKSGKKVDFTTAINNFLIKVRHDRELKKMKDEMAMEISKKTAIPQRTEGETNKPEVRDNNIKSLKMEKNVDPYRSVHTPWIVMNTCRFIVARGGLFLYVNGKYYHIPSKLNSQSGVSRIYYDYPDGNGFRQVKLIIPGNTALIVGRYKHNANLSMEFYDYEGRYYEFSLKRF